MKAFVLGAGLGTRLRPLTANRPKPLVPVFGKPLLTFAFDHLLKAGVTQFVVNTHHLANAYETTLGFNREGSNYDGHPCLLCHEPVLLDTGGGIRNVAPHFADDDFFVHNGDVIADLDLTALLSEHRRRGNIATLGLRRTGGPLHIAFDPKEGVIKDIHGKLGSGTPLLCLFTGISVLSPRVFPYLEGEGPASVIPAFLDMLRHGERLGGILLDDGIWLDLGTLASYWEIHRTRLGGFRLSYLPPDWPIPIDPLATIGNDVRLEGWNVLGPRSRIHPGASLENCIVWPDAVVAEGVRLKDCIVTEKAAVSAHSCCL